MRMLKTFCTYSLPILLWVLAGCNNSDDVEAIFTQKTWKLTLIAADGQSTWAPLWNEESQRQSDLDALRNNLQSFTLRFTGLVQDRQISGNLEGQLHNRSFTGTWTAHATQRNFSARLNDDSESSNLAQAFKRGLSKAYAYEGDDENLYILYREEAGSTVTFRLFFKRIN